MKKTIDALVQDFADNVAAQRDATRRGDSKTGNKYAKRYAASFQKLRALGDQGRDALVPLTLPGLAKPSSSSTSVDSANDPIGVEPGRPAATPRSSSSTSTGKRSRRSRG
jgi:hypothetical protein